MTNSAHKLEYIRRYFSYRLITIFSITQININNYRRQLLVYRTPLPLTFSRFLGCRCLGCHVDGSSCDRDGRTTENNRNQTALLYK